MIGRLDRYVGGVYLWSWLTSAVFFLGLFSVVSFFQHVQELLKNANEAGGGAALIGRFYLYQMPTVYTQVAPFVMLMAALFTVMRLQRHNELMAMLMTGRSALRVMAPVLALTVVFIGLLVYLQERVVPRFALARTQLTAQLIDERKDWTIESIHIKDARGFLLSARDFHVNDGVVAQMEFSGRDEQGRNVSVSGHDGTYDAKRRGWRLVDGTIETRALNQPDDVVREPAPFFATDLRPEDLLGTRLKPFDLSYPEVLDRSERYPNSPSYRMLRHYHVTYPVSVLLLVLLGLPFVLKRQPRNNMLGIGISILMCLGFLILDATVRDLGTRNYLTPVLAAWLPVILAGSLVVVMFDSMET